MPNHFHALITIVDDTAVEEVIGRIKGRFSYRRHRELGRAGDFWQPGLSDKRVRTRAEFLAYRKYIWMNPVEAGLVASPELWPWSTANPRFHKAHAAGA
jgi:putative transposase